MKQFALGFLAVAAAAAVLLYLATQPGTTLPRITPDPNAAQNAEARLVAAFKAAGVKATFSQRSQPAQAKVSDLELTSIVDQDLGGDSTFHDVVLHGDRTGLLEAGGTAVVNGIPLPFFAAGTVTFAGDGTATVALSQAELGRLPMPGPILTALQNLVGERLHLDLPPGIHDVSLQPVDGGAVISGTADPVRVGRTLP